MPRNPVIRFAFIVAAIVVAVAIAVGIRPDDSSAAKDAAAGDVRIAVVNVQSLLTESDAAKDIQKQLTEQREKFQSEMEGIERKLKEDEQALGKRDGKPPSEELLKKRSAFEKEIMEARKLAQKRRRSLEKAYLEATVELKKEVTKIVAGMFDAEEYDLVLTSQDVVMARKAMDITEEVMKELNGKISKVPVKVETN